MQRLWWIPLLTTLGCAAPAATPCEQAVVALSECAGSQLSSPFTSCDATQQEQANSILSTLDTDGCDGPAAGKADGALCALTGWDPFGWCDDPPAPLGDEPIGQVTQYPIILAHGFNTSTTNFWRFNDVDKALMEDGHQVVLGSVPPFDASSVRANFLADQVDELINAGATKVNLVCFSQGGVDCRYLASEAGLDYGSDIASITLISAPNRGSFIADATLAVTPRDGNFEKISNNAASWFGGTFSDLAEDSHFLDAMESMSEANMAVFNETVLDHPDVFYQSWAGFSHVAGLPNPRDTGFPDACVDDNGNEVVMAYEGKAGRDIMDPLLVASAAIVGHGTRLLPNDGVATVESAKWGLFRGCIPADHLDQVGQISDGGADRRTGFDYIRFYRNIAFDLAARGY